MRILSALPAEALIENIMLARMGAPPSSLSPAHAVQIGLVVALVWQDPLHQGRGKLQQLARCRPLGQAWQCYTCSTSPGTCTVEGEGHQDVLRD